jgi:hypothetical protein
VPACCQAKQRHESAQESKRTESHAPCLLGVGAAIAGEEADTALSHILTDDSEDNMIRLLHTFQESPSAARKPRCPSHGIQGNVLK